MLGIIWLAVLSGTLFVAGAYAQTLSAADDGDNIAEPESGTVAQKFDAGFYQKIQDMIESDGTGLQDPRQETRDPAGPRGASDAHDGGRHYNVIIVVGRDGNNPDEVARQNKKSITQHLESLGARDIVAAESLSFVTASIPVSKIPALSLREEVRQMGDGELPLTALVGDTSRQTIHATPSDLRQSSGIVPNGTGVVVAVIDDEGINNPYLNDKVADRVTCSQHGCWQRSGGDNSTTASHGTQVASVLAASGVRSNNGIAPGATLLDAVRGSSSSAALHALDWSYSRGADVANQSFGFSSRCGEDRHTMSENMIMNEAIDKGLVVVNAAGNGGGLLGSPGQTYQTIGQFPCIRNIIAVGGIDTRNAPPTMYTKSSRGPISNSDPRLAPHIVAPVFGVPILLNTIDDATGSTNGGTSFAAPQVSATAAILLQVNPELAPAGVRAALLLGADWTGPVPCTSAQYEQNSTGDPCSFAMQPADLDTAGSIEILNNVGFGILNVAGSLGYANSSSHIISDHLDATTGTRTYELDITSASRPVKVILTWMIHSEQSPVDLNLEIATPGGSTINASSVHQTTEFAVFDPPETGIYTVTVRGSGLPDRPVQTFALAGTSGLAAILPSDPPPPAAPLTIDAVGSKKVPINSTLRVDLRASGGAGPVTWSIDEKTGARIHPDTGHLVYLPPAGPTGPQTITVRADDGNSSASRNIVATVTPEWGTIEEVRPSSQNPAVLNVTYTPRYLGYTSFGAFSDGAFTLRSDVIYNEIYFPATASLFSQEHTLPTPPDQLHIFRIYDLRTGWKGDRSFYAQVTPGQDGFKTIPNPFTRPDPFAPSFGHTIRPGMTETITPDLVGFDGDPLTITDVTTDGTRGTAIHTDTTITYTPEPGATGTDTITYTVTDNRGRTGTGTINLLPPPTVNDDTVRTDEDTPVNIDVLGNDTAAGARLSASDPPNGTATVIQSNNTITYNPHRNYHGPDSFTYTVTDDAGSTATGTVRITVTPVNDLPIISGLENRIINELEPLDIPVTVADVDNTTDQLTLTTEFMGEPGLPDGMELTRERLTWTPTESQGPGTYPFAVRIGDGLDQTARGFVFTVSEVNQNPEFNITGTDRTATQGIEFMLDMNVTDDDLPEQEITCMITLQDTGRVPAQINPQTCIITWTPADLGDHVIRVQATDDHGGATNITTINIDVGFDDRQPPVITLNNATQNPQIIELGDEYEELGAAATDDHPDYGVQQATPDASGIDINNTDTYTVTYTAPPDPEGKTPETVTRTVIVLDTTKPVIDLNGSSSLLVGFGDEYDDRGATVTDNDPDYDGTVTAHIPDIDSTSEGATYTVTYSAPADDAGNAPDNKTRTLTIGRQFAEDNVNPVALDDSLEIDEDSGEATVMPTINDPDNSGTLEIVSVTMPSKGEAGFNRTTNTITYTPGENEYGPDSFTYTIEDNREGRDTGTINVTITGINDPPVLQTIDDITLDELVLRTVILNATDVDNATESLVWTHTGAPAGLDITGNLLTWEPTEAQGPGDHPFTITVSDNIDADSQTVTFAVNEVNQNPVLHQDNVTATEDVLREFQINATDDDIPRQTLTYRFEAGSTVPSDAMLNSTGHFSWTPAEEHSGERHVIAVTVEDGAGGQTTGSFTIRVDEVSDPPDGNITYSDDGSTVIAPVSNNTIVGILEAYMSRGLVAFTGGPASGLDVARGNTSAGFLLAGILVNGAYAGLPGAAIADHDDITVFVSEIGNVPPVLSPIGDYTINAQDTLTFAVSATDFNDTASYRLSGAPDNATISEQGIFRWAPGPSDEGSHTFTITAHDGHNATDIESVTITVLQAGTPNESPIAPDVTAAVPPNDRVIIIPAISDPDGDPVRITGATGDAGGAIVSSDNRIEYIAGPNPGAETVTYAVQDSRGAGVTGTITITIR